MVAFNQLVATLNPGTRMEIDPSRAVRGLPARPFRIMCFGQRLAAGSKIEAELAQITRTSHGTEYFGQHSMMRRNIDSILATYPSAEIWAMALDDDGAAVQATGTITLSAATTGGVLYLYIAGERLQILITSDLDANAIAITAAINLHESLHVSAAVNPGDSEQVIVTALNGGLAGNDIDIRLNHNPGEFTPAGLGVAIVGMASGAADPDVATLIAALSDKTYDLFLMPWTGTANLDLMELELEDRWDGSRMLDGISISCIDASHATHITAAAGYDSEFQCTLASWNSPTPPPEIAGRAVGSIALSATLDPVRGFNGMELKGAVSPDVEDRFTTTERRLLLEAGLSTLEFTPAGEMVIGRMVTNWVTDTSQQSLPTMLGNSFVRWSWVERMNRIFLTERFKAADDETLQVAAGEKVLSDKALELESIAWFVDLQTEAILEGKAQFIRDSTYERAGPSTFHAVLAADIVNPLYNLDASLQYRL